MPFYRRYIRMYIIIKRHDGSQVMSLKNWLKTDLLKKSQEMVNRTLKFQNFRGISVSYVVWSIEMSLTEIQLGPYFLR